MTTNAGSKSAEGNEAPTLLGKQHKAEVSNLHEEMTRLGKQGLFLTDTHAHMVKPYMDTYAEALEVLEQGANLGVNRTIAIGISLEDSQQNIELVKYVNTNKNRDDLHVYATVGLHPSDVFNYTTTDAEQLAILAKQDGVVGIGEIGLDYHYDNAPSKTLQQQAFREQLEVALQTGLPVAIHNRDAHTDTMQILQETYTSHPKCKGGVMHCFPGNAELLKWCLENNFHVSYAGNATFKNAELIREDIANTPMELILVETDAPYLTPSPFRGQGNKPHNTIYTAYTVARVKGVSMEEIVRQTEKNVRTLFAKVTA